MIWSLSAKNVWRNKTRSIVIIASIALGTIGGIMSAAVYMGISERRIRSALRNEVPDILLRNHAYKISNEAQDSIAGGLAIMNDLKKNPAIVGVSPHMLWEGMASTTKTSSGVSIEGINPELEKEVFKLYETIADSSGIFLNDGSNNRIVVGQKLADKLGVKLTQKIVLTVQALDGSLVGGAYRVAGIYKTESAAYDEKHVYLLQPDLSALTGSKVQAVHGLNIRLKNMGDLEAILASLKKQYPMLEVETWKDLQPDLAYLAYMAEGILPIIMFIILLALAFGIVNTMLMAVLERMREFGMLRAIGMKKRRLFNMVMLETVFLTLTGGLLGMILTKLMLTFTSRTGIEVSTGTEGYNGLTKIYPNVSTEYFIIVIVLVILTGIFSSLYPAIKTLKIKPLEALRADS